MCNLETLRPTPCVAVLRDDAGNTRKLRGKFRSLAELWEYARSLGCTVVRYMTATA
jgi:hypothetical protein